MRQRDPRRAPGRHLTPRTILALGVALVFMAGCSPSGATPPADVPASPVEGVVVGVDSRGLGQVRGFTLRTDEGATLEFVIDGLENPVEFPPSHLSEHRTTSEPVRVFFRVAGDRLVVYRLEDAGNGGL